jgi:hypothetical protein
MDKFNAEEAKKIATLSYSEELNNLLNDIKYAAHQGQRELHIYRSLKSETVSNLRSRGFNVDEAPSIAIQRDSLYYTITW